MLQRGKIAGQPDASAAPLAAVSQGLPSGRVLLGHRLMNAPATLTHLLAAADAKPRLREIPYNYTSFSDREIV
ncbi:MAG: DUF3683 domain-containing protein, partial [Ottowia sp.]|nr:DUF3683 domain-containing protein [Ottowia sp.]